MNYDRMKSFHTFSSLEKEQKTGKNRTEQNDRKIIEKKIGGKIRQKEEKKTHVSREQLCSQKTVD